MSVSITGCFDSAWRMRLNKQTPEMSFRAEIHHQTSLLIDAHAGRIQRSYEKKIYIYINSKEN